MKYISCCVILVLIAFICGCVDAKVHKDTQAMMGTFVQVLSTDKNAAGIVFKEIKRIEGLLSKYDPLSEISRLNAAGKLKVSPETFFIVKKAKEFSEESKGAFDITVGPLVGLWGFKDKDYRVPSEAKIKDALRLVGSDKIVLQEGANVVKLKTPGMVLDLGAIAKGYAVDKAVARLKAAGIKNCLINAGGEIYCMGVRSGSRLWKVAVQDPRGDALRGGMELKDSAVATSGDYEQYFIKDGKRYAHIIDPRTGYPAASRVSSVTVTGPDCLGADALATAFFVLGPEGSSAILDKFPGYSFTMVIDNDA